MLAEMVDEWWNEYWGHSRHIRAHSPQHLLHATEDLYLYLWQEGKVAGSEIDQVQAWLRLSLHLGLPNVMLRWRRTEETNVMLRWRRTEDAKRLSELLLVVHVNHQHSEVLAPWEGVWGSLFVQHLFVMPWRPSTRDLKNYDDPPGTSSNECSQTTSWGSPIFCPHESKQGLAGYWAYRSWLLAYDYVHCCHRTLVKYIGMIHDDCLLLLDPTLEFIDDGSDVLLAPPSNWTFAFSSHLGGNPAWGHWRTIEGKVAIRDYFLDARVQTLRDRGCSGQDASCWLAEFWGFAAADHFVVSLHGANVDVITEQLRLAAHHQVFLELAVPTLLALLSVRPAFAPALQGGRADVVSQAQSCMHAILDSASTSTSTSDPEFTKSSPFSSDTSGAPREGEIQVPQGEKEDALVKHNLEHLRLRLSEKGLGKHDRGVFACHPLKMNSQVGIVVNILLRDMQLMRLLDGSDLSH